VPDLSQPLEALVVEWATPSALRPNPWNPNRQNEHEFKLLCMSIEDAGFTQPVMVVEVTETDEWMEERANGYAVGELVIVDGEHRWRAAHQLGIDPIPYVRMPFGATQARLSTLQMNRARGTEDLNLATEVLRDLEKLGVIEWAGDRLGMTDEELGQLLDNIAPVDVLPGDRTVTVDESGAEVYEVPPDARSREYQAKVQQYKDAEDKAHAGVELHHFRLVLTFADEEANIVRTALGDEPAAKVLHWCRTKDGAH
jgi:ParB-like chromosome segregation protein Spo0J